MPRCFFHIANGKTFRDDLGELFLGIAEAMVHATDIAEALVRTRDGAVVRWSWRMSMAPRSDACWSM
jgi:hypothetical protein